MRAIRHPVSIAALAALLAAAGCTRESNRWQAPPADKPGAPVAAAPVDAASRIVLFAPIAVGPLRAAYPEARLDFAHDLARRMDLLLRGHDGRVGENLPDSDHPAWDGRVAAAGGAHLVVLARIEDIARVPGQPGAGGVPARIRATARLRALDVDGREVWARLVTGEAEVAPSPKLISAAARPESRAAWDALATAMDGLFNWLSASPDLSAKPDRERADVNVVEVLIDSKPPNADILVDGELKGTTPRKVRLPVRPVEVRLERQGHRPWARTVTPSAGLELAPALEPVRD